MKQDDILREKFGRENHFRVPEGYFDDFADRMMEMIPEAAEAPAVKSRREIFIAKAKLYLYLAAMFCGLFFGIKVIQYNASRVEKPVEVSTAQVTQEDYVDQYIDDVCDFAGIGSEQIYACVTDADTNY